MDRGEYSASSLKKKGEDYTGIDLEELKENDGDSQLDSKESQKAV